MVMSFISSANRDLNVCAFMRGSRIHTKLWCCIGCIPCFLSSCEKCMMKEHYCHFHIRYNWILNLWLFLWMFIKCLWKTNPSREVWILLLSHYHHLVMDMEQHAWRTHGPWHVCHCKRYLFVRFARFALNETRQTEKEGFDSGIIYYLTTKKIRQSSVRNLPCNSALCINFTLNEDCEEELANWSPSLVSRIANIHKSVLSVDDSANLPFSFCFHLLEKG